ncbi:MAG: sugar ABC transporter permease [Candidatus Magasanikbacteria bacterium CG_4_10_14_0_8_um_filter_32_14]|uniref:Transport permease protein n=2 Tax=Candidatus Magasanikiibacteriota TaxID=1752731 RepID=A0A2M7RAF6_9BACT|nr:MAG: sugar ABC transporter permease [Candidatus Magasanikbacteria bacterium CG1_02_32_51]PIY93472.1 MAG: sugar ABC transporter permease [Candidatus Magasanikbacteria bacterium CG_4_10_14_0_8_um_filter_32_14]
MNWIGFFTIYKKEMARTFRVPLQTIFSPVITTVLYFIVFGSAIGSRITVSGDVSYSQFIVPGLIMMSLLSSSLAAASSGIYFPKFTGTIYELLSAPLSYLEITLGYTLSAATRAMVVAVIIYIVSLFFTPVPILHPFVALLFVFLTAFTFAMFGFIIGLLSDTFEKLNIFPTFVITPLSFLGGVFYSVDMLPDFWHKVSYANPIVYMINGLRWSFFGTSTVSPVISMSIICGFLFICLVILWRIFKTGYKIKT